VIRTAEAPPVILPGSIAGASLLSHVFSSKFENHLPYFRIEKQFSQIGVNGGTAAISLPVDKKTGNIASISFL
jgi:transposase